MNKKAKKAIEALKILREVLVEFEKGNAEELLKEVNRQRKLSIKLKR